MGAIKSTSPFSALVAFIVMICLPATIHAQTGTINGRLVDGLTKAPLAFGTIRVQETNFGSYTDSLGEFKIQGLPPGLYNLEARYTGYEVNVLYEVEVIGTKPTVLEIPMNEAENTTDSVVITASPFKKIEEAPLSLRTIGTSEIKRNPGGNRDISKVIQSLPGVASTVSFRNDILIRGGAPNENRFYIDGIETPNINHFATQGASGGPVGLINVDFIGEVDFFSGAFPANRGNALSSVFEFRQREARDDRLGFTATLGASDLALTLEGPVSDNSSFMFSYRRSYLQFLFRVLALPFLPTYNDYQFKQKIRLGQKHEIKIVSLGALDDFALNLEADSTDYQKYILGNLPVQTQWSYTFGVNYKYFGERGFWQVVASRNMLNNESIKYSDNNAETGDLILDYESQEIENKLRIERTARASGFKWTYGVNYEYAKYTNSTFAETQFGTVDFESALGFNKYGAFGQVSKNFFNERLVLSAGARVDGNTFSEQMQNPLNQFSPRVSASVGILPNLTFNLNTGIFYQLPPYTILGFRDNQGNLANQDIQYIRNKHVVAGFSYTTKANSKLSVEGYYKNYDQYPFLTRDSISLANLGGDFGVVGNEPAISTSEGRTYGMEFLYQQRLYKGFYGIVAYTLGWSEFKNNRDEYVPSSWDSRHIIALTLGKKFKGDWEVGAKWRFTSGTPFTPADIEASRLIANWEINQREIPDYDQLNSLRTNSFHQLDMRVDKKWYFNKWSLNLFIDIQNVYGYRIPGPPILDVIKDENDLPQVDGSDPSRYQTRFLENDLGIFQPTIGIVVSY
ncbi:carboxypeptidase-like regulatory domain-containing protein [Pontibacter sp. G13]|uniref:TonB-dependent receptor n=1 Tax=Pontibacter sp. G13 TaxID=3074898 RepID=UPI00288BAC6B|nr:carboxypeptidase-like regulatory domain-containing protein [Pontibacter sp. G13]WNJ15931.1 carboxypeptidase-like regulatory domain-containing protein [Pontibacter sp. G13]